MFKQKLKLIVAVAVATLILNTTGDFRQAENIYNTVLNWGRKSKKKLSSVAS